MASNSSSLFDVFYKNNNRGLEGSIPNMDSTRVNQQYDSSVFNAASYAAPPYIPNQQNFSGLIPFSNDLPSQMGVKHPFSLLNMASSSSSMYSSPFVTNYNNFNHELMPFSNDLSSQMGVEQLFSPLNMASSSSSYSSFVTNYNNFNELMPLPNEMASEMGFMGTTIGQNEFENFNGLMPFPNEMPSEMGFSQTKSGLNDPQGLLPFPNDMPSRMGVDQTVGEQYSAHTTGLNELEGITTSFDALIPFPNNDIPSISGMVDVPQIMGDEDFTIDMDSMDLEFMTKWLEREEELNQKLTNDGALAISTSESSNELTQENTYFESTNNGVRATLSESSSGSIGVPHTSNNEAKPFGKRGLLFFQTLTNKPWESRRLKTSTTVQISDANFHMPKGLPNSIPMDVEDWKAGPQFVVQWSNSKGKKVKPLLLDERRKGWIIETRMRANGFLEKFYYHMNSKQVFRSTTEVENFIIDGIYPARPQRNTSNKRN